MHRLVTEVLISVTTTLLMVALVLFLGAGTAQPRSQPGALASGDVLGQCLKAPLSSVDDSGSGVEGAARLCVAQDGVQSAVQIHGLWEGLAYTAWLAYFERPSACLITPCGFVDLRGDDPVGVLGRIDGAIAPQTRVLELRADLRDLQPAPGAQVTVLVLRHAPGNETDGRARARQLLTPQMFDLGAPMAGAISDRGRGWLHGQAIFTIE